MSIFRKKKSVKLFARMMVLGIIAGSVLPAYAMEEKIVSYIYHQHIGNSTEEGGCYKRPIYHSHGGDELLGGMCYETPVYHSHVGNETDGGSCYENMIYHVHEGDGTEEAGCYVADYHTHSSGCYRKVDDDEYGCYVVDWWDTSEDDYEGHDYKWFEMSCGQTIHGTNSSHYHNELNCGRGEDVTGYILGCGKTEESIDGYYLSCEKTAEYIEGYELSCSKTFEEIDGYERSCGKEEDIAYGEIIVTKQSIETEGAIAFVEVKDYTGGELQFSEEPYEWYDEQGNLIGTGDSISVSENGIYQVRADIVNEDINQESLWAEVSVDNIRKPEAAEPGEDTDNGEDDDENIDSGQAEQIPTPEPVATTVPTAAPTVAPTATPIATPTPALLPAEDGKVDGEEEAYKQTIFPETDGKAAYRLETEKQSEEETASPSPTLTKETKTVKSEERGSQITPVEEPKTIEKAGFFNTPLGKTLIITAGTFAALTGIFVLFYLLRQSVKIYNDDGQGNMIYLGRIIVQLTDDGYLVVIGEQMAEKALTNRYCIKPGLFRVGKSKEEEMLIEKQNKRISVLLQKEMIVVI